MNPLFSFQLLAKHIFAFTFPRLCVCEFTTSQLSKARSSFIHCTYPVWSSNLNSSFTPILLFPPENRQVTTQSCETPNPTQNPASSTMVEGNAWAQMKAKEQEQRLVNPDRGKYSPSSHRHIHKNQNSPGVITRLTRLQSQHPNHRHTRPLDWTTTLS